MMPPSRCCTCLFCPVATNDPDATTALASGAMAAHAPNPTLVMSRVSSPSTKGPRVLRGTPRCHSSMLRTSWVILCLFPFDSGAWRNGCGSDVRCWQRRLSRGAFHHAHQDLAGWSKGFDTAGAQDQQLVHA